MRRVALVSGAVLLVWSPPTISVAIAKPAALSDATQFQAAVSAVRSDANNYDKFKEPVSTGLTGHAFSIRLPIDSDIIGLPETKYDYEGGRLVLGLEPDKAWPKRRSPGDSLPVITISSNTKNLGSYVGQNAFGATAKVTSLKSSGAGIAIVNGPKTMVRGAATVAGMSVGGKLGWWTDVELPPAQAKALALASSVLIEGTYANLPWGDPGFCDFGGLEATLDNPTDYYSETCYLGANVTRIAIVNGSGAVLREWTSTKDPVIGPELWRGIRVGMDKYQLKALFPTITDYGRLDDDSFSASVRFENDRVSKVEVLLKGASGDAAYRAMISRYGQPLASKCVVNTLCNGQWRVSDGVVVYLTIGGLVTYQLANDPPPYGFSL